MCCNLIKFFNYLSLKILKYILAARSIVQLLHSTISKVKFMWPRWQIIDMKNLPSWLSPWWFLYRITPVKFSTLSHSLLDFVMTMLSIASLHFEPLHLAVTSNEHALSSLTLLCNLRRDFHKDEADTPATTHFLERGKLNSSTKLSAWNSEHEDVFKSFPCFFSSLLPTLFLGRGLA